VNIYKPAAPTQTKRYVVDLSATMAVCDANYIRLLKLMPHFGLDAQRSFALPVAVSALHENIGQAVELLVVETFKYTCTIRIRMTAPSGCGFYQPPCILVRVYHDANTAEVISFQEEWHNRITPVPEDAPLFYPDEKEQINMFLAEWLTLCIETGLDQNAIKLDSRTLPGLLPTS
jgi:uncharacterized protein YqiB (DUF1249 family)